MLFDEFSCFFSSKKYRDVTCCNNYFLKVAKFKNINAILYRKLDN